MLGKDSREESRSMMGGGGSGRLSADVSEDTMTTRSGPTCRGTGARRGRLGCGICSRSLMCLSAARRAR